MGFFDKKEENKLTPDDLVLSKLKVGYMVDYDLKTWEIIDYNVYDWGDDIFSEEWTLETYDSGEQEILYLEKSDEDGDLLWSLTQKMPVNSIDRNIIDSITDGEEPPSEIEYENETFYIADTGAAYFLKHGTETKGELIVWDFEDETEEKILTIEQWGEYRFELFYGIYVDEEDFENIFPAPDK